MSCRHKFSEKNAPIIYKSAYKLVGSLRSVEISTSMPTGNCVGPCHPPGHPFFLPHIPTTLQPPHTNTPPPPPHTYDTPCSRTPPLALPSSIITCSVMARRKKSAHTHERRSQDTTTSRGAVWKSLCSRRGQLPQTLRSPKERAPPPVSPLVHTAFLPVLFRDVAFNSRPFAL